MAKPKKSKKPLAKKTKPKAAKAKPAKRPPMKKPARKPVAAKKPAKQKVPAKKKVAAKKPAPARHALAYPISAPASDWRSDLRNAVIDHTDFATYLASLAPAAKAWEHADTPELAGLEHWGTELAKLDHRAGVGAVVRAAQIGIPLVLERGGIGLDNMGFHADEGSMDGAPVEKQIRVAAAWLDAPDAANLAAVKAAIDPGRQLQIWEDDLRPAEDAAYWWYSDVGQCCLHAITRSGGKDTGDSYYDWPPETCVGRGLVIAVRGLRTRGDNDRAIIERLRAALVG